MFIIAFICETGCIIIMLIIAFILLSVHLSLFNLGRMVLYIVSFLRASSNFSKQWQSKYSTTKRSKALTWLAKRAEKEYNPPRLLRIRVHHPESPAVGEELDTTSSSD